MKHTKGLPIVRKKWELVKGLHGNISPPREVAKVVGVTQWIDINDAKLISKAPEMYDELVEEIKQLKIDLEVAIKNYPLLLGKQENLKNRIARKESLLKEIES